MKCWINKNIETDNVVVLSDDSLVLGSCDEEKVELSKKRILDGDTPDIVFGTENFEIITFSQIFKLLSRSTDTDVEIHYKVKKEEESKFVDFEDIETAESFLKEIQSKLPERLKKKEFQQSLITACLPPLLSLITALGASAMFINKLRWLTLIIGGAWALFSLYRLFVRAKNPPVITMWSSKNVVGAAWSHLKMAGSLAFVALIVLAVSTRFPDSYGENAFVQHMDQGELTADDVEDLVENGGNINSLSSYDDRPLHYALYDEDEALFRTLLENGADPSLANSQGDDALDSAVNAEQTALVQLLLAEYKSQLDLTGRPLKYVESGVTPEILNILFKYGADPSEINKEGLNLIQVALTNYAEYELVSMLVENQVPTNVQLEGLSLKQYALDNGQDDVAQLFDNRDVSFERERELTTQIDAFYAKALDAQLEKASGIVKLMMKSEGLDEDRQEMAKDLSKSLQYKTLSSWGNQLVIEKYAQECEKIGFEEAADFTARVETRAKKLADHSRISQLIIERNRSIYNEAKDEFVIPAEYKKRVIKALSGIDKQYSSSPSADATELSSKCASVYSKVFIQKTK